MDGLLGTRLRRWDFQYLQQHLPSEQKYGVMLDEGSGKIVMSHTARNGQRQIDLEAKQRATWQQEQPQEEQQQDDREALLCTSDQTRMTFCEFQRQAESFQKGGEQG